MGFRFRTRIRLAFVAMLFVGAFIVGLARLEAQGSTGSILGTVTDATGAAVPEASVQVKNVGTGVIQNAVSDAQGRFRAPEINIGEYELQASKAGFTTVVRKGVILTVGSQAVVDFSLQVGQQNQTVTVEAAAAVVETTNAAVGTQTSQEQMRELPLNGRNFEQLIQLAPGVSTVQFSTNAMQGRAAQYSVAGGRPEGQSITLDDENLQSFWNNGISSVTGSSLGVEAIAEFQTLTNAYGAQFGGNGSVINAASKSGTNSFHGSAFDFLRNSALDARDFFLRTRHDPPPFRRNQFGGSVGGPIQKDKFFFFVDYEGIRQYLQQNVGLANVPDCSGGFSSGFCNITATNPITATAIKNTLLLYPTPDNPGGGGIKQATTFGNNIVHENYVLFRLDYTFSAKDSVFARYFSDKAYQLSPFAGAGPSVGGGPIPTWPGTDNSQNQYTTIEERHIVTSNIVNLFKVSYSRPTKSSSELDKATAPDGSHPLQFFPQATNLEDGFVNLTAAGLTPLGPATGTGHFTFAQNRYAIGDDVLWTKGAHSIRIGFSGDRLLNNSWNPISEDVVWTFTSFANFLAGNASVESGVIPAPGNTAHRDYFQYHFSPYIQDDWKVSRKLNVNVGIRYEGTSNVSERHDLLYAVLDFAHDTDFTRVPYVFQNNPSLKNFDPRIGIAYDPFSNHKTAVRAGMGLFHDPITVQAYQTGFGGATPWRQASLSAPFAIYPNAPTGTPPLAQTVPWYYPISSTPYMIQYNLNIQHEVLANTVLSLGYVGSKGTHLLTGIESNPPTPTIDANGVYHFGTPTSATAVAPFPRLNPGIQYMPTLRPISDSRYNSLQVSVNRRLSRSVQAQLSYTYSKCIDDGAFGVGSFNGLNTTPAVIENPFDQKIDKAVCSYDIPHVFRVNGLWVLPFHGNKFVRGWQLSGIMSKYGGVPVNPNAGYDVAGFSAGNTPRANYVAGCDPYAGAQTVGHWFNTSCYTLETPGTFGNAGRNTLRGPGFLGTDLSLSKETVIREQIKLQFRWEVFNILNHENFGNPGNNIFSASGLVNTASAGVITNSNIGTTPRQMQFALKLTF
jgi:Carboxypeptidase regulatory-like domain/TonB-dependent Receptor Plug Domain